MSDVFDVSKFKVSDCPTDFIPAGAEVVIGVDYSKDSDCTVKGFYDPKTGEYHIQEVLHNVQVQRDSGSIIAGGSAGTTGSASLERKD